MSDDRPVTITLFDSSYARKGTVPDYVSVQVSWDWLDVGSGQFVVTEDDPAASILLEAHEGSVMVTVDVAGRRWSGRVAKATLDRQGPPGTGEMTATLVDDLLWLRYMLASQSGSAAVATTMPQYDTRTGPVASVAAAYINAAAQRLSAPVLAVAPTPDETQTVTLNARMTPLLDLLTDPLKAAGVSAQASIWLPGDNQPPGAHLDRPTVVVTLEQPPRKPWLRWSDASGAVGKVTLISQAATGYRAVLGLDTPTSDDPATRRYDSYTDTDLQAAQGLYALPEVYADASDAALGDASQARGRQELAAQRPQVSVAAEVNPGEKTTFGKDYVHGDLATLVIAGVEVSQRITRVTVADDRANGLTFTPVVGDVDATVTSDELMVRVLSEQAQRLRQLEAR